MLSYPIPMVPGPVKVPEVVLQAYQYNYGSADMEPEFLDLYKQTESCLQRLMGTQNQVVIQTGEGMLALWTALKSCLNTGDRVLSIGTGIFGYGIGDMARSLGASVRTVAIPYNQTITNWDEIEQAIADTRPKMITVVHCETPSGTLNPIARLGELKKQYEVPLLYVDAVSSIGGTPVLTDAWHVDLMLGGAQKVISAPAGTCFLAISDRAWEIIQQVNYVGYDALLPFKTVRQTGYFPYTPYWQGIATLKAGAQLLLDEGLENVFSRHEKVSQHCRSALLEAGYTLYPVPRAIPAPTVTAVNVPPGVEWAAFDRRLRDLGLVVGGNYGPLAGKVFRLGHMGSQADLELVGLAVDVLKKVRME